MGSQTSLGRQSSKNIQKLAHKWETYNPVLVQLFLVHFTTPKKLKKEKFEHPAVISYNIRACVPIRLLLEDWYGK